MAFKSANLKMVYEGLRARGVLIDPETAASLFSRQDLEDLLMKAMQLQSEIQGLQREITTLQDLISATPPNSTEYLILVDSIEEKKKKLEDLKHYWDPAEVWF